MTGIFEHHLCEKSCESPSASASPASTAALQDSEVLEHAQSQPFSSASMPHSELFQIDLAWAWHQVKYTLHL